MFWCDFDEKADFFFSKETLTTFGQSNGFIFFFYDCKMEHGLLHIFSYSCFDTIKFLVFLFCFYTLLGGIVLHSGLYFLAVLSIYKLIVCKLSYELNFSQKETISI